MIPTKVQAAVKCATNLQCAATPTLWNGCEKNPDTNAYECIYSLTTQCWLNAQCALNPKMKGCQGATCGTAVTTAVQTVSNALSSTSNASSTTPTGSWYEPTFNDWAAKVYDTSNPTEIFGERYTAAQVYWVIYSLFHFILTGGSPTISQVVTCAITQDFSNCTGVFQTMQKELTAQGPVGSALASVGERPISGITYVKNLAKKLQVPEVYAQTSNGYGFSAASFILDLWRVSRNIAYALLVVVVVIMAFMIMFRVKLSPQLVISVQSALPKIVLTLILITFSYAIAGFLIDLMYVVIGLLATFLSTSGLSNLTKWQDMYNGLTSASIFLVLLLYWVDFIITALTNILGGYVIFGIIMFVLSILSILALLWFMIKIFLMMIKTFANIMFLIILAPLQIMAGTIIQGTGFGSWLKAMMSNLLVYPVTGFMLFFAFYFMRQAARWGVGNNSGIFSLNWLFFLEPMNGQITNMWSPPLSGGAGNNYFAGSGIMFMGISFTIISMIPKIADMIKSALAGKGIGVGTELEGVGNVARTVGKGAADISSTVVAGSTTAKVLNALKWLAALPIK